MARPVLLALVLAAAPAPALACEFHGGPWGLAFARMMHAGPGETAAAAGAPTPDQANEAALAALRAQFLQRFRVQVEGEAAAAPESPAAAAPPAASASATPMP